jgi:hypothetical protein
MRALAGDLRVVAPIATLVVLGSTPALADMTKDQCVDANGDAQELRREGKLLAAREKLRQCIHPSCPAIVQNDCIQRLDELDRVQPTIVFEARDAAGNDVGDVHVLMDGRVLVDQLDGTALAVDSGQHVFTFQVSGQPITARKLLLREGEKVRHERIVFEEPVASAKANPAPAPPGRPSELARAAPGEPPDASSRGGGVGRTLGLVMAGVGVAGLAAGSVFGLLAFSSWSKSQSECHRPATPANCHSPHDAGADHDAAMTSATVSTVTYIAGGALTAAGLAVWMAARHEAGPPPMPTGITRVAPSVGPHLACIELQGAF